MRDLADFLHSTLAMEVSEQLKRDGSSSGLCRVEERSMESLEGRTALPHAAADWTLWYRAEACVCRVMWLEEMRSNLASDDAQGEEGMGCLTP